MIDIFSYDLVQIILKIIFVVSSALYFVYTFIVFRQIQVMKKTLITSFSPSINLLGLINLFLAGGLLVGFWIFL
jgi:hypothetical protein